MSRIVRFLLTTLIAMVIGCSHLNGTTAPPPISQDAQDSEASIQSGSPESGSGGHHLWGYWLISVDPEGNEVEIIPVREIEDHLNVLKWLEQGPCTNCVKILNIVNSDHGTKLLTISLKHPFSNPNLTGFDVRGIAMFNGSHAFPTAGFNTPDRSHGDGELINADGYTTLYNYTTAGSGSGGMQGYIKGKLATFAVPNAKLNGFKRFVSSGVENTRNAFYAGDTIEQTYDIDMPDSAFVFGYAVDASWAPPTTKPVTDPMKDFPPEANCPEPWQIETPLSIIGSGLDTHGGEVQLSVNVYDYQGKDSYSPPILECPELFDGTKTASWISDDSGFSSWGVKVGNDKLAPGGDYKCLVKVVDSANAGSPPYLDLTAYQIQTLHVGAAGWARTWGGSGTDYGLRVTADGCGDVYVLGTFNLTVDFDPGPGVDSQTSNLYGDVFLSKFDSSGNFIWARTWGGTNVVQAYGIAVDGSGNIWIAGRFSETADFDPGPGTDSHISNGWNDSFVTKFDSSGNFLSAWTWGGTFNDEASGVAVDSLGNAYVTGGFMGTADFDPGLGTDNHTSNDYYDAFLSKFDSAGNFVWADTWGGADIDVGQQVALGDTGDAWVTGWFTDMADFDPGVGTDSHASNGGPDAFVSKFDPSGNFVWARTWGGPGEDEGMGEAVDAARNVYVCGHFLYTVDFDAGPGIDERTSNGESDIFLNKFDSSGSFIWARTWGGATYDHGRAVALDDSANACVAGKFNGEIDFDPGTGTDYHTGYEDVFLSKISSSGDFIWARTWGTQVSFDDAYGAAVDASGNAFVTGTFLYKVDFDPGPGVDMHTSHMGDDVFLSKFPPDGNW